MRIRPFAIAFLLTAIGHFAQAQSSRTLDEMVPTNRQKSLGLDRLSPDQRDGVAQLLQEMYLFGLRTGERQTQGSGSGSTEAVVESQVDGSFNGWEGETIIKLLNGQIWRQTEYHYHYHYAFMPKVLVYRSGSGYKMKVDGTDSAVGVQRLR